MIQSIEETKNGALKVIVTTAHFGKLGKDLSGNLIISALPISTNKNAPKVIVELYAYFFDRDILLEQSEQAEALRK